MTRNGRREPMGLVAFATRLGVLSLRQAHYGPGLKRLLYPVGYWRYPVLRYVISLLKDRRGLAVLDVGSPKLLALWLALEADHVVYATDLQDEAIFTTWDLYYRDFVARHGAAGRGQYRTEFQDGRRLSYADASFDVVYSISVIEHIPGDGDSEAMREIARVLKPGGLAIVEIPYAPSAHDEFLDADVYGRRYTGTPLFYQRHYDETSLADRLVRPSGMRVVQRRTLRERVPFERYWSRVPEALKAPLYWTEWLVATANLREVAEGSHAMSVAEPAGETDVTLVLQRS